MDTTPTPTLFDPVAVTYAFRPDLCPAKPLHIDVDDKGLTKPTEGPANVQVCLQSDEKGISRTSSDANEQRWEFRKGKALVLSTGWQGRSR